jgi:uncharacterized membrane protein
VFDSIGNMPLHPLVVHAVVVGAPLAALLGFMFAVPRFRAWARWPLGVVAVGAFAAGIVAKASGEGLKRTLGLGSADGNPVAALIARHSMLATQLVVVLAVYAVLAVLNALVVGRRTGIVRAVDRVLPLLLVVVGVLVLVWCYRVGDIGSRAVWNPTGTQTF